MSTNKFTKTPPPPSSPPFPLLLLLPVESNRNPPLLGYIENAQTQDVGTTRTRNIPSVRIRRESRLRRIRVERPVPIVRRHRPSHPAVLPRSDRIRIRRTSVDKCARAIRRDRTRDAVRISVRFVVAVLVVVLRIGGGRGGGGGERFVVVVVIVVVVLRGGSGVRGQVGREGR